MAASHGSKANFWLGTMSAPTVPVDISVYGKTLGLALKRDTAETSTFGVSSKKFMPGLKDSTIPFDGPLDAVIDQQLWDLLNAGTLVNFEYYPVGKGTVTTPKFTGVCFITTYGLTSPLSGPNDYTAAFQVVGDVVRTVQ